MEVLKEVVKTILLDVMFQYACLKDCLEYEFTDRIKTQKGVECLFELAEYSDILNYLNLAEPDVTETIDLCNRVIYSIASELIETNDVKFEFRNKFTKF